MFRPRWDDYAASPYYQHYSKMAGFLKVEDVSLGGICVSTTFLLLINWREEAL